MARGDSFGSQFAVWALAAFTATSASTWYIRSERNVTPEPTPVQKVASEVHAAEKPMHVEPAPMLRPLALLATAIGSEPLYELKEPGEPMLSPGFAAASSPVEDDDCRVAGPTLTAGVKVCDIVEAMRRKVAGLKVKMLIATLPDWVDSSLQWTFDPMLDAIQMSAAQMGYVLSGFDMADTDPEPAAIQPKGSVWPYPRVHEITPGSLLFRRSSGGKTSDDPDFLLILLVGETATAGVHSGALAAALDLAVLWEFPTERRSDVARPPVHSGTLGILGPTYSGSSFSLERGLEAAAKRHRMNADRQQPWFDLVTGSASSQGNPAVFAGSGLASFRATTRSDQEELSAIARYLGRSNHGWQCGDHMALLVEANTSWGRGLVTSLRSNPSSCQQCMATTDPDAHSSSTAPPLLPCATVVPFPLHISRLRGTALTPAQAGQLPTSAVTLDLAERLPPVDRIPPETPQLTSATVEIMVGGMFRAIQDRAITTIGILATDKRDHLYLAEEIARHRPNVLAFTIESSLMYLHPDVAGYVRGTLVASTYSLSERTQRLTRPLLGQRLPQQFGSSPAHGAFNALAVLMGHPDQLLDYDVPEGLSGRTAQEVIAGPCRSNANGQCLPPVWISVVGRNELLPVDADIVGSCRGTTASGHSDGYALCPGVTRTSEVAGNASIMTGVFGLCREHQSYLTTHKLFLLLASSLVFGMLWYQVRLQRRIDVWRATRRPVGHSSAADWLGATKNLLLSRPGRSSSPHPSAAEFAASLVAMRGATIGIFLWLLKLALIYAADACNLASSTMEWLFTVVAMLALIYVVWQTIDAFWSISGGTWRLWRINRVMITLILVVVAVAAIGHSPVAGLRIGTLIAALGLLFSSVLVFVDSSSNEAQAALTLTRWRRLPALLALGAFIALTLDLSKMNWSAVQALVYADRAASISDLVSPASTIVLFSLATFWWGVWNVRRLELLRLPEGEVGIGALLGDRARAAGIDPQFFRQTTLKMGMYIVLPAVAAVVALWYGRRYVGTVDGGYFGKFLLLGGVAISTIMLHALAHSMHLGRAIVELLKALARHPGARMFRVLGKEPFSWRITYSESTRAELETLRIHIARLDSSLDAWGAAEGRLLPRVRNLKARLKTRCHSAISHLSSGKAGRLLDGPLELSDWQALNRLTRILNQVLKISLWQGDRDRLPASALLVRSLGEMEYIVFFHASLVLRDLLMRLVSGFTMVIGGMLILVVAHLLYTFEGRVFWLSFDSIALFLSSGVAVRLLLILERDPVLSSLWGTLPGKISLFGGLTWRMLTYGVVSLATIFAVQFPELGGQLLNWVAPARAVLGE